MKERLRFKTGAWPRHFGIDGKYIYVACQKEGKVYQYSKEDDKIMQLTILNIANCSCTAIVQSKWWTHDSKNKMTKKMIYKLTHIKIQF